ncbi:hypothetical protein ACFYRN_31675 [Streptomyces sp. NPDC005227]|uniref:hypothetical protein n=1 Tax=Streptomyces sp. NPDC005227 TaxID=3364707 RepID=UPI0036B1F142
MRPTGPRNPTGAAPARAGAAERVVPHEHEQDAKDHQTHNQQDQQDPHRDQHQEREQYA